MKAFLAACVAFGAITVAALPQAHADDIRIGVPGVHVDVGGHDRDREAREAREHRDWDRHADEHREREVVRERCVGDGCR
jgi:hypothetical protein